MSKAPPTAIPAELQALLSEITGLRTLPERLGRVSAALLGRPYRSSPLIGGPDVEEVLVTRVDGFDCVTFAETALALAWSERPEDHAPALAAIRYLRGRVRWIDRNHYMSRWIARNVRAGRVRRVLPRRWVWGADAPRALTALPGYPTQRWRPRWLPTSDLDRLADEAMTGDVVCFASNRPDLDTYHVGLLVQDGSGLAVRHASRRRGEVVHQPLSEYLASDDVPGMLVVRPLPSRRST